MWGLDFAKCRQLVTQKENDQFCVFWAKMSFFFASWGHKLWLQARTLWSMYSPGLAIIKLIGENIPLQRMQPVPGENKTSSWGHCQSGEWAKQAGFVSLKAAKAQRGIQNLEMNSLIWASCCWKDANNWLHRLFLSMRDWQEKQTKAEMTICRTQNGGTNHCSSR